MMYTIPAKQHQHEELIKSSQFITTLSHAPSADDANNFIAEIKKRYPDASHNCWAYVTGPPADSSNIGMSDDGEPHGTAGKPMLNVLLHSDIGEIVAVVTRYFGGTKLGPGGLVKAYSESVKNALEELSLTEKRQFSTLELNFEYSHINAIKRQASSFNAEVIEEQYEINVRLVIEVPNVNKATFIQVVKDITSGTITVTEND